MHSGVEQDDTAAAIRNLVGGSAENRMQFIGVTEDTKKVNLLRSWGGADLVKFMKTHASVRLQATPAAGTAAEIPADMYAEVVKKTKAELRKLVNKTMARLMKTNQGDRNWMDFIKDLEDRSTSWISSHIRTVKRMQ